MRWLDLVVEVKRRKKYLWIKVVEGGWIIGSHRRRRSWWRVENKREEVRCGAVLQHASNWRRTGGIADESISSFDTSLFPSTLKNWNVYNTNSYAPLVNHMEQPRLVRWDRTKFYLNFSFNRNFLLTRYMEFSLLKVYMWHDWHFHLFSRLIYIF